MKTNPIVLTIILHLALVWPGYGTTQPNDNFADRIVLTGNDVTFTGSLSGATLEANEMTFSSFYFPTAVITHSVWWSWTATESGPVTLVALSYSEDTYIPGFKDLTCALAVYPGTNIFGSPPMSSTNIMLLNAALDKLSLSFSAVAGTAYQVQFSGVHTTLAVAFRLVAANSPVVLEPPADQTVSPGGSALFTVVATGLSRPGYQWRLDGVELPGATSPMLALNNVTTNQAGAYSVVVSNATGTAIAGPANLTVNANPLPPFLEAGGGTVSNGFAFTLAGEQGRYYRILSSTNRSGWSPASNFPSTLPALIYPAGAARYRSVVFSTNSTMFLSLPRVSNVAFVRACVYAAPNEVCNNHLKQIRFAKLLWARSLAHSREATPLVSDLQTYCPEIMGLTCPLGGSSIYSSYWLGDLWTDPGCQRAWTVHVLEEP